MRALETMAFVEVQFASDTVAQTIRDVRYTFAGILSNLGNIFFLFFKLLILIFCPVSQEELWVYFWA